MGYAFFKTLFLYYHITNRRLIASKGLIARRVIQIELFRVKNLETRQSTVERVFGIGKVLVYSAEKFGSVIHLVGIRSPLKVKELILELALKERDQKNVQPLEIHNL